jgi:hypothetical protein
MPGQKKTGSGNRVGRGWKTATPLRSCSGSRLRDRVLCWLSRPNGYRFATLMAEENILVRTEGVEPSRSEEHWIAQLPNLSGQTISKTSASANSATVPSSSFLTHNNCRRTQSS